MEAFVMQLPTVLEQLKGMSSQRYFDGHVRLGIPGDHLYGVSIPALRVFARKIGSNHDLALQLWESGVLDARWLASMIDDPKQVSEAQMDAWAQDFDNWAVVDQCCGNLFDRLPIAYDKAMAWSVRPELFIKRASFVLMASLAVHDKRAPDAKFTPYFPIIRREATDSRLYVKKAVNWALRGIGKRNAALNALAIEAATEILALPSKTARWIATDALRELQSDSIQRRLASVMNFASVVPNPSP
jgi:3-methyladenine DNA glycosylase AlkD